MRAMFLVAALCAAACLPGCASGSPSESDAPWFGKPMKQTKTLSAEERKAAIKSLEADSANHRAQAEKTIERR